jgi:hypothetical protein
MSNIRHLTISTGSNSIGGFKTLPPSFEIGDQQYRLEFGSPYRAIIDSIYQVNSDLEVEVYLQNTGKHYYNEIMNSVVFYRRNKVIQALELHQYFFNKEGPKYANYHELKTYATSEGGGIPRAISNNGKYILKPIGGARSLGLIIVDTNVIPIDNLNKIWSVAKDKYTSELSENESSRTGYVEELMNKLKVQYIQGDEFRADEAAENILTQPYLVQEFNPFDDVVEFRAYRFDGRCIIYNREDLPVDYVGYSTVVTRGQCPILSEIESALTDPEFPGFFGSVDIWYSKSAAKWGIYEYQPEFDCSNIPNQEMQDFMKQFVHYLFEYAEANK